MRDASGFHINFHIKKWQCEFSEYWNQEATSFLNSVFHKANWTSEANTTCCHIPQTWWNSECRVVSSA